MNRFSSPSVLTALLAAACAASGPRLPPAGAVPAGGPGCAAAESTLRFEFHSSFWLNLHNFLYREAGTSAEADGGSDDPFGNFAVELPTVRPPDAQERAAWDAAVRYYEEVVRPRGLRDSAVVRVNNALATTGAGADLDRLPLLDGWADALRSVAPVYAATWWPAHDAANRAWIGAAGSLVDAHLACLDGALARALDGAWGTEPVRVDVSVYASWFGAYTTLEPQHITVSSTAAGTQGEWALETLLHEAGHALLPPLRAALEGQPPEMAHLVLFFTAGELVRARVPDHIPFAYRFDTWARTAATRALHDRIRAAWLPVLEGRRTPAAGIAALRER